MQGTETVYTIHENPCGLWLKVNKVNSEAKKKCSIHEKSVGLEFTDWQSEYHCRMDI